MTPFTIVILICSLSVSHADCQPDTALDVVQGPRVSRETDCGFMGQAAIATTAIVPRPDEEYAKIICQRDHLASAVQN